MTIDTKVVLRNAKQICANRNRSMFHNISKNGILLKLCNLE